MEEISEKSCLEQHQEKSHEKVAEINESPVKEELSIKITSPNGLPKVFFIAIVDLIHI